MRDGTTLGEFLRSRRHRLRPEAVGIRSYGQRRVPGLRREELAMLAGISPTYYGRLEQGQGHHASPSVIEALASALRLSGDERAHLHALARTAPPVPPGRRTGDGDTTGRGVGQLLDAMVGVAALVIDARSDVIAWNPTGHLLMAGHLPADGPERPERPNLTRMLFLDPRHRALHARWDTAAVCAVAALRVAAGRRTEDRGLRTLVEELAGESPEFAALWAEHPIAEHGNGPRRLRHPEVGDLSLDLVTLLLSDGTGQRVLMYGAAPGSPSHAALARLTARAAAA